MGIELLVDDVHELGDDDKDDIGEMILEVALLEVLVGVKWNMFI